jgi:hypothetical protein
MANLLLHCGAQLADPILVAACPTPEPTETWQPIPHARLLGLTIDTLQQSGMEIVNQAHALARGGDRYFGLLEIRGGRPVDDYGMVVGLRNSHDQRFPAGLVFGHAVFVCDNLAFFGEVVIARKHTQHIQRDLPQLLNRAVGELDSLRYQQDERIAAYKRTTLERRDAHHLLIEAMRSDVLPPTRLPVAVKEFDRPSHEEFWQDGPTAWRLFNAVTEAIKGRSLASLPRRTQALHGLLDAACDLAA